MRIPVWVAALLAMVAVAGCAGVQLPREGLRDPGELAFDGYVNPKVDCYRCHDGDGRGACGPNLAKRVPHLTDDQLRDAILNGKGWFMPAFKGKITDDELAQIVTWLRASFPAAGSKS